ncbi:yceI-like domain protein [Methyloversatilis sp. RAC08]|uniref:YceI family protein n=1 Tax=Methyloversatilis sp. RAC08 TaxID=1842540 RepID=UPI00083DAACC|nr:YceI family protein [Methyloversatilis sp. RAC08]AOF81079.1 yceI-like domain protein [Methyloversatilis sp. RAC08]
MKLTPALFGLLMGASLTTGAMAADSYTIDSRHTFPTFEINHLGFSTQRGRFNSTSGKIMLVPSQNSGSIEVKIDTASIDMGLEAWDKHMRGEDFFNSEQFPAMTFKSTKLMFDGDKLVGAEGDLTLLGVTKPVTLDVKGFACGTHPINKKPLCGADISTTIKRSDFGMTKYLPGISDIVYIEIPVEAFRD